jgi:hypothetical protein
MIAGGTLFLLGVAASLLGRVYSDHRIPVDAYSGLEIPNTRRTGVQNVLE